MSPSSYSRSLICLFPLFTPSAIDGEALHSVMADPHKLDDFVDFDVTAFDLEELLNYEPTLQVQHVSNNQWIDNNQDDVIGDAIDPMEDPFAQGMFEDTALQPSGSGNIYTNLCRNETFPISEVGELHFGSMAAAPISCSFCQVLREIVHTNGYYSTKLEIHGRVGMIFHAILVCQNTAGSQTHQMLNLSNKSIECVRDILLQYCESRKQAGFVLVDDPMAPFYEALCVGLDLSDCYGNSDDEFEPLPLPDPTDSDNRSGIVVANQASSSAQKTRYQKQRERAAKLTVEEVAGYFHLTLTRAAKELGLCATVVKRFCRRHGVPRWPYRKIKGYENKISDMREALQQTVDVNQKRRIEAEIAWLGRKIDDIYARFRASPRFRL